MGLFGRKKKKEDVSPPPKDKGSKNGASSTPPPPEPPQPTVLDAPSQLHCTARKPWGWVMESIIATDYPNMQMFKTPTELPTGIQLASVNGGSPTAAPAPSRGNRRRKKGPPADTLRIEVVTTSSKPTAADSTGDGSQPPSPSKPNDTTIRLAIHGTSEAFDGLEDKDELVRTLQRCRCEHLELSPPSRLINWDVTKEECMNLVGDKMPRLLANDKKGNEKDRIAVLKEPMGRGGTGVFFVKNALEINDIIEQRRKQAVDDPEFLDQLIAQKGRIPSWGKSMIFFHNWKVIK